MSSVVNPFRETSSADGRGPIPSPAPASSSLDRYFEITLYLMVLAGFATLASTGTLDIPTLLIATAALIFRGYLVATRRQFLISENWTNLLTLAYLGFYLTDYLLLSGLFLSATVHLVLFVMLVRLYSARRDRHYYFLAALAFLMVLAAAVLTVDSVFLACFAGFMLMAVATFILMEMRHAAARATIRTTGAEDEKAARGMGMSLAGATPVIVVMILFGASVIFFALPRVSAGYLSNYAMRNELSTGFSDHVELGQIGQIQQSRAVAMHVAIDGDKSGGAQLLLRGVALSVFDGKSWSNPGLQYPAPRSADGRFALPQLRIKAASARPASTAGTIHYTVLMEPLGSAIFFVALSPQWLQGSYRNVATDRGGAVYDLDSDQPVGRYEAWSDIAQPSAAELRAITVPYPARGLTEYLRVPPLDPRIPALAAAVTASASTNYDKAVAVETYLRTHFGYTLQLSRTTPRDPLAEFLFTRKQGHCEYFASSMAVMLRTLGIPTRVVNGFRMSEFNELTSQYVVRESDAHSWVEVFFPGYGWVSFDPTPAGEAQARTGWTRMLLFVDAMQSFWREWIINYDVSHQMALGQGAIHSSRQWWMRLRHRGTRRYEGLMAAIRRGQAFFAGQSRARVVEAAFGAFLLLLLVNGGRFRRAFRQQALANHPEKAPTLAAVIWYERMTEALARKGWPKPPSQTPGEFVRAIGDAAVQELVARFTQHYEWARFGGSADHARQLPGLYHSIVTSARR